MPLAHDLIDLHPGSNAALALAKLAPPPKGKDWSAHLEPIVHASRNLPDGYADFFMRTRARTAAGPAFRRVLIAESLAPTICGMGERTPGENGLTLHPVYGVPYLPGTSLKGILRAWVLSQGWGADWQEGGPSFDTLFGKGGHDGASAVVDFLDALPLPAPSMLTLDVLTPHFADYYSGKAAPLGWQGPNPVQFLTAAKGVSYRVVVEGEPRWVEQVTSWLALALTEQGIGAKSRAGYGRFACALLPPDDSDERAAAAQNERARMSHTQLAAETLRALGKDSVRGEVEKWLTGEPVSSAFEAYLPDKADALPESLALVATLGATWGFRDDWAKRADNPKADDKKKARARELIAAWDARFPPSEQAAGAAHTLPSAPSTPANSGKFGTRSWDEPKKGVKPNKVAAEAADCAGTARAYTAEAIEACLAWLRANDGKRGQLNQVRRAYEMEEEP